MTEGKGQDSLLRAEAWGEVAEAYRSYWSPRFRPFIDHAVATFSPAPRGPIAVPGCGPGDEVLLLAERFPERSILATDVSPQMATLLSRELGLRGRTRALATVALAEDLSSSIRQAAGVFSSFVLQLLPDPLAALADWSRALSSAGTIPALFWPRPEPQDPFARLSRIVEAETGVVRDDWVPAARARLPDMALELVADDEVEHALEHPSPEQCFRAFVDAGPLRWVTKRYGGGVVRRCGERWLRDHGLEPGDGGWRQSARARLWQLRKVAASR